MTTSWYGKSSSKQLQQLLENRPRLVQLLAIPDFLQQLKSYNPKLLQYITNTPSLILEGIQLMTLAPRQSDSPDRKYKLPLQVIEMIETETTCILNSFFKQTPNSTTTRKQLHIQLLFTALKNTKDEILPLLAGYFFRTCICLLNNRYKEMLDFVYSHQYVFNLLLQHCYSMPICNTIQLFLNLDVNKSSQSDSQRLQIKKNVLTKMIDRIDEQRKHSNERSSVIIQNLMTVMIQTIEKYYLIQDGKALIDLLTYDSTIETMLKLIQQNTSCSFPAFSFFISLINYYSFSSFNADEVDEQKKLKNLQRLQSQPMVDKLKAYFPTALEKILKPTTMTLYEYKLLEVLCHCISISSEEILAKIKQTKFFAQLITLMFKHEQNNILHMLIEKSFLHVFISQRKIYQKYKQHLFCEIDIIELTAGRVLKQNDQTKVFQRLRKKKWFGHFMRILKIYSGIQTTQESIINSIKAKTEIWNKVATYLIKPYQNICFKQLGTYDNIPQGKLQQFTVTKSNQQTTGTLPINIKPLTSSMIQEIRKQDELLPLKKQQGGRILSEMVKQENLVQKRRQQQLLKSPTHNFTIDFKGHLLPSNNNNNKEQPPKQIKKTESFKEFMNKKKVQAEKEIREKRSLSHQKRLSGSKGKITAMSPKKNSWTQKTNNDDKDSEKTTARMSNSAVVHTKNSDMPKIPHYGQNMSHSTTPKQSNTLSQSSNLTLSSTTSNPPPSNTAYRSYYGSSIQPRLSPSSVEQKKQLQLTTKPQSRSESKEQLLKKIKVIRIQAPKEKKYRKLEQKDKVLLEFLGIVSK